MAKPLTFLIIVLGLWAYAEIQTQGTQHAFGGALAGVFAPMDTPEPADVPETGPITERVRYRVSGVMQQYEQDRLRMGAERP